MKPDLTYQATLIETDRRGAIVVLCKQHYLYEAAYRRLVPDSPFYQPMIDDYVYETHDARNGRLLRHGRDTWPVKAGTDVIVEGHACAPQGRPISAMRVHVRVGEVVRSVHVMGDRYAYRAGSAIRFSEPEPFERVSLDWWNAYGGVDPHFLPRNLDDTPMLMGTPIVELFPGAYPRNPMGVGYVIEPKGFFDEMLLPNVEDPKAMLAPESLFVGDPRLWWRRAAPAGFGWMASMTFPRCVHAGYRPYHVPAEGDLPRLPEVLDGRLEASLFSLPQTQLSLNRRLTTEGAPGMVFSSIPGNTVVQIDGMTPDAALAFRLPPGPPEVTLHATRTGRRYEGAARLHTVHVRPDDARVNLVWATTFPLSDGETRALGGDIDLDEFSAEYVAHVDRVALGREHWPMPRPTPEDPLDDPEGDLAAVLDVAPSNPKAVGESDAYDPDDPDCPPPLLF